MQKFNLLGIYHGPKNCLDAQNPKRTTSIQTVKLLYIYRGIKICQYSILKSRNGKILIEEEYEEGEEDDDNAVFGICFAHVMFVPSLSWQIIVVHNQEETCMISLKI